MMTSSDMVKQYLKKRLSFANKGTDQDFLGKLDDNIKIHTFSISEVAQLRVLEKVRSIIEDYSTGRTKDSFTDCKNRIDAFLSKAAPGTMIRASKIRFVIQQEFIKATAVGQFYEAMLPQNREDSPYFKFVATLDTFVRPTHRQYHGLVLAKEHPFWRTHFPPLDFNCRCTVDEDYKGPGKDKKQKMLQKLAESNVGQRESENGFAFDPYELFENQDITSLKPKSRATVMADVKQMMKKSKGGRCTFVCKDANTALPAHDVVNVSQNAWKFSESEARVKEIFEAVKYDMNRKTDYKYQVEKIKSPKLPADIAKALPKRIDLGKLDGTIAKGICSPSQKVFFSLEKTESWGFRHEWIHHKEFFEDAEYGLGLLNDTLGCPGARVTKTFTVKKGAVETQILIHNTEKNVVCVLREFDDRFEVVSVHELNNPDYPDEEASILQVARGPESKKEKTPNGSVPQNGVPSAEVPKNNIKSKNKKSSRKQKKHEK